MVGGDNAKPAALFYLPELHILYNLPAPNDDNLITGPNLWEGKYWLWSSDFLQLSIKDIDGDLTDIFSNILFSKFGSELRNL